METESWSWEDHCGSGDLCQYMLVGDFLAIEGSEF